ncbi:1,4-alpha-glucan branching protein GlgB [Acidovorax sp.]|uniref:1,4-alpha-glucan branching protein GlgB n=1 Tax=Acidovorax sp. TaxID=1872122 RepID=UPI003919F583
MNTAAPLPSPTAPRAGESPIPFRQYETLGAHVDGTGARFAVWAPNAQRVQVIGSFNDWTGQDLIPASDGSGRWSTRVEGAGHGDLYKYRIKDTNGRWTEKADPFATRQEHPPGTASQIWRLDYQWHDGEWMASRGQRQGHGAPMAIYEVHLGSWQRQEDGRFLNYRDLAQRLVAHCTALGFTHVELMPITEHPFYGSWGYQTTGYFAPTARYGNPQDLMTLVDTLHQHGIGVLLDWVVSHFPADQHGLARFDGTALYEHEDLRKGFHPEWNSLIFNYDRYEVRDFLISNALFWLGKYHFDGIRVDAVSSMLYLDFARKPGEWVPNPDGGHQNWEAVRFLQDLNGAVYAEFPDVHVIAEESTAWKGVSRPVHAGGLGFGMKWNMGWMNDTLRYMQRDAVHRHWHEGEIRFSMVYAFEENYVLALSHDEVVYGKGSLLSRQPGDAWQRFAGLRTLYGMMWSHPGKKLLFMGGEFAQVEEWHHERALDWHLWAKTRHSGMARWVTDLNRLYRDRPALHAHDFDAEGFAWMPLEPHQTTVLAFVRRGGGDDLVLAVHNLTPMPLAALRVGVPAAGHWYELLNSDAETYGGSGMGNFGGVEATPAPLHGQPAHLHLTVPPLSTLLLSNRPSRA